MINIRFLDANEKMKMHSLAVAIKCCTNEEFPADLANLEDFINKLIHSRQMEAYRKGLAYRGERNIV